MHLPEHVYAFHWPLFLPDRPGSFPVRQPCAIVPVRCRHEHRSLVSVASVLGFRREDVETLEGCHCHLRSVLFGSCIFFSSILFAFFFFFGSKGAGNDVVVYICLMQIIHIESDRVGEIEKENGREGNAITRLVLVCFFCLIMLQ